MIIVKSPLSSSSTIIDDILVTKSSYWQKFNSTKGNKSKVDDVEKDLIESIKSVNNQIQQHQVSSTAEKEETPNSLFCRSLITTMDELTPEQCMIARIKIQQALYEIKYSKEWHDIKQTFKKLKLLFF